MPIRTYTESLQSELSLSRSLDWVPPGHVPISDQSRQSKDERIRAGNDQASLSAGCRRLRVLKLANWWQTHAKARAFTVNVRCCSTLSAMVKTKPSRVWFHHRPCEKYSTTSARPHNTSNWLFALIHPCVPERVHGSLNAYGHAG